MATRDNFTRQAFRNALDSQANDDNGETFDGETIDTQGFDSVSFVFNVGESGVTLSASIRIEAYLEHAPDNDGVPGSWVQVPADQLLNAVESAVSGQTGTFAVLTANAQAEQAYATGYRGSNRFVRMGYHNVGTHASGTPVSGVAVLGHAHLSPAN